MDDETLACMNAFMSAAGDVLRLALRQVEAEAPGSVNRLHAMTVGGGLMSITAVAGACTGMAQVHVQVSEPGGQVHTLLLAELQDNTQPAH